MFDKNNFDEMMKNADKDTVNSIFKNLSDENKQKVNSILNDKEKLNKILSDKSVQDFISKLNKKNG
ncbi:MAG: hypothetical protein IJD90_05125 [Clostridia bacterium]|nr:hypothetical protein [Clostridia bacterium]